MKISVVIPTYNEASWIDSAVKAVRNAGFQDVLVVDGGSSDHTVERALISGARVLEGSRGRATQMNAGARLATGDTLLFLHADTSLPSDSLRLIETALKDSQVLGGAFHIRFDSVNWMLRFVSFQANVRSYITVPWGDQAFFIRKTFFNETGGFKSWGLMEDVELAHRIKKVGRLRMIRDPVVASARRFHENGLIRNGLRNQLLIAGYYLGISPDRLAKLYRYR